MRIYFSPEKKIKKKKTIKLLKMSNFVIPISTKILISQVFSNTF